MSEIDFLKKKLNELFKEQRGRFAQYFYQQALFSAGAITLSTTFLGFLASSGIDFKNHEIFLLLGWTGLSVSLTFSLMRNYIYPHFIHYQAISDWNEEVYTLDPKEERKNVLAETRLKERLFSIFWKFLEFTSIIAFFFGVFFIMFFAARVLLS